MNKFGEFLYELRKEKGYTQTELADIIGVSNRTVSMWETGNNYPDTAILIALSDTFGVTVDELLKGKRIDTGKAACEDEVCAVDSAESACPPNKAQILKCKKLFAASGITLFLSIAFLLLFFGLSMAGHRSFSGNVLSVIVYGLDMTAISVGVSLLVYAVGKRKEAYSCVTDETYIKRLHTHIKYVSVLHFVMFFILAIYMMVGVGVKLSVSPMDGVTISLIALEILTAALLIAEALRWDRHILKSDKKDDHRRDTSYVRVVIASATMFGVYLLLTIVTLVVVLTTTMPLWLYVLFTIFSLLLNGAVFALSAVYLSRKRQGTRN